jgi:hypothetical protein
MFRSTAIIRELVLSLAKVILKHSVKLCPYRLCGGVAACLNIRETLELLKPCHKGTRMKCWETFYMQTFHQHKLLITEQQISDINLLYELADTSRIPLQKNAP